MTIKLKYANLTAFEQVCTKYKWSFINGIYEDDDIIVVLLPKEDLTPEGDRQYGDAGERLDMPIYSECILVDALLKSDKYNGTLARNRSIGEDLTGTIDESLHNFL